MKPNFNIVNNIQKYTKQYLNIQENLIFDEIKRLQQETNLPFEVVKEKVELIGFYAPTEQSEVIAIKYENKLKRCLIFKQIMDIDNAAINIKTYAHDLPSDLTPEDYHDHFHRLLTMA